MKHFQKTQLFEATAKGTKFAAIVECEMPYAILGKIMDALMVRRQMTSYFKGAYDRGKEVFEMTI